MVPESLKKAYELRMAYKHVFNSRSGELVLQDLIKRYIRTSPIADTSEATHINLGMQLLAQKLVDRAYSSDEQLRREIAKTYEQQPHE